MENVSETMQRWMNQRHLTDNYRTLMAQVYADPAVNAFYQAHKDELSADVLDKSAAKLYEFVNERRKLAHGDASFATGYEPELIISNHLVDVAYTPTKATLAAQADAKRQQRVRSISMPKEMRQANLADFEPDQARTAALSAAMAFIAEYTQTPNDRHQALYLSGKFGVGKTYLLAAMANQLAEDGVSSTLVHFPSFAVAMKNAIGKNTVADDIDRIKRTPILMIDDIGADSLSAWVRDDVLGVILEYRMQESLPTFFSSNFSMRQLETEHLAISNRGDDEPLKAKRLMQRIRYLAKEVPMGGINRRPQ